MNMPPDKKIASRRKIWDYFLLIFLVATTANPYFFDANEFLVAGLLVSGLVFFNRGKIVDVNYLKVTLVFLCLEFLQYVAYGRYSLQTFLSVFIKLTFAYC